MWAEIKAAKRSSWRARRSCLQRCMSRLAPEQVQVQQAARTREQEQVRAPEGFQGDDVVDGDYKEV